MESTILVIEDEQSIADVIVYNLQKEGFSVYWERDGRDGLLKAQSLVPDLCVLDLMLPGIDGLQICRLLKSDPRTKSVPVMVMKLPFPHQCQLANNYQKHLPQFFSFEFKPHL